MATHRQTRIVRRGPITIKITTTTTTRQIPIKRIPR
jgi:hypothetical protein